MSPVSQSFGSLSSVPGSTAASVPSTPNFLAVPSGNGKRSNASLEEQIQVLGNIRTGWSADVGQEIHSLDFSPQGEYLALGLANGNVLVYQATTGEKLWSFDRVEAELKVAATTLKWRPHLVPESPADPTPLRNVLAIGYPDGTVVFWHGSSGQKVYEMSEGDNQIFSLDYCPVLVPAALIETAMPSLVFATGGSDCKIRVYVEKGSGIKPELWKTMFHGARDAAAAGHSNRVFCVRWHPTNPNHLISGGWDSTIQIWDLQAGAAVRSIYKPHICGETLDWDDSGRILAGSRTKHDNLTLFAFDTGKRLEAIPWSLLEEKRYCPIYACRFSPSRKFFIAGGGGGIASMSGGINLTTNGTSTGGTSSTGNELKVFNYATRRCVAQVVDIPGTVFASAIAKDDRRLALGGAFNCIYVIQLDPSCPQEFIY